jgi:AcrR family transcriptional regulator
MGRQKTISDEEVIAVARKLFRDRGYTVSTREIAQEADISEAVLYQRFGSKDDLFYAAMSPPTPDIEKLLGSKDMPKDVKEYLLGVVQRIGAYFGEIMPLILRLMTHPSFDLSTFTKSHSPTASSQLETSLKERLLSFSKLQLLAGGSEAMTAKLLVSLAHDWGLRGILSHQQSAHRDRELKELFEIIWKGLHFGNDFGE